MIKTHALAEFLLFTRDSGATHGLGDSTPILSPEILPKEQVTNVFSCYNPNPPQPEELLENFQHLYGAEGNLNLSEQIQSRKIKAKHSNWLTHGLIKYPESIGPVLFMPVNQREVSRK